MDVPKYHIFTHIIRKYERISANITFNMIIEMAMT